MPEELLRITFDAAKAAASLGFVTRKEVRALKTAVKQTAEEAAKEIKRRGDNDIQSAGNFSARWTNAFRAVPSHQATASLITVGFDASIPYAAVHEFGATIRGKPLLWIPLPWNAAKVRAREYPGRLVRVNRPGKNPLLIDPQKKEAEYVGVPQVTLRKRFHIRSITANVVRTFLARTFYKLLRQGRGA